MATQQQQQDIQKQPQLTEAQALAQEQTQAITGLLQAPIQFGTDKLLINVNGANSKIKSNKNGIIKYTLEQPHKLEIGDKVTLIESFVEEKGLSLDTIEFETDVEEELRFLYYQQGNVQNSANVKGQIPFDVECADVNFKCFPEWSSDYVLPNETFTNPKPPSGIPGGSVGTGLTYFQGSVNDITYNLHQTCFPTTNNFSEGFGEAFQDSTDNGEPINADPSLILNLYGGVKGKTCGANGQYYYLMEFYSPYDLDETGAGGAHGRGWKFTKTGNLYDFAVNDNLPSNIWMRPMYGRAVVKIPAGNYSVSALADLINQQLDGSRSRENRFNSDALIDKLYYNTDTINFTQTSPFFQGTNNQNATTLSTTAEIENYNPDVKIIGQDTHQPFQRRSGYILEILRTNSRLVSQVVTMNTMRYIRPGGLGTFLPKYINNHTPVEDYNLNANGDPDVLFGPNYSPTLLAYNNKDDMTVWNPTDSPRICARALNNNVYLHLDGLRSLMSNPRFYDGDYDPIYLPSLADWFRGNISDEGLYYLNQNTGESNPHNNRAPSQTPYWQFVEDFKWQLMVPVSAMGYANSPVSPANAGVQGTGGTGGGGEIFLRAVGVRQQFCGTASFNIKYDVDEANRFSITNLHEPFKLPSKNPQNDSETYMGGQQATLYNSPIHFELDTSGAAALRKDNFARNPRQFAGIYPVDSNGGVAVNNWSFSTVKDTSTYQNLVSQIQANNTSNAHRQIQREQLIFELFTKPYDEFFDTEEQAQEAWKTTLWNRLGYGYNQLGAVSKNLETIFTFTTPASGDSGDTIPETNPRTVKQMGIITHNQYNYTQIPSSSGLGLGNPFDKTSGSAPPANYTLNAYSSGVNAADVQGTPAGTKLTGLSQNYIHILSDSKAIEADDFPSLNAGNNYLLISSDIVKTNAKDAKSNSSTIVGIMSKENASNDTLFSINPITFTVTEPKLLSTIEVKILNPDGTLVSDDIVGLNNGFIFQVEKAIEPAAIPLQGF